MSVFLAEPFASLWAQQDIFSAVEALEGDLYRELEGRRTLRTEVNGHGYFVKIHRGIGWGEIVKNLLTAKLPVLGARNEYLAIQRLQKANVATMTAVAFAERGSNPARQHSFIITEELAPTISLEDYCMNWPQQPLCLPSSRRCLAVADMTGRMHRAGVNHLTAIPHISVHTPITQCRLQKFRDCRLIDFSPCHKRSQTPVRLGATRICCGCIFWRGNWPDPP